MLQANFFTANIEIKKKIVRRLRIYFFKDEFSLEACLLEPYLTVLSLFSAANSIVNQKGAKSWNTVNTMNFVTLEMIG